MFTVVRAIMCAMLASCMCVPHAEAAPSGQQFESTLDFPFFGAPSEAASRPRVYIHTNRGVGLRDLVPRGQRYCVRACDGRFFPIANVRGTRDGSVCQAMCPSAEMTLYSGSSKIDNAHSPAGQMYKKSATAFLFQRQSVPGCTCNAKLGFGMTTISAEKDPTIKAGDIIAAARGWLRADNSFRRSRQRTVTVNFSPVSVADAKSMRLPAFQ